MAESLSPEIIAWLLGMGPSPFAVYEDSNSQVIQNWDLPKDEEEIGTFDFQNDRLTAQNKANNQYADMAQIAQLGNSTGGFSPEDFVPEVTYEPVKAPGYQAMLYYQNSNDPVMKYIAKRLGSGPEGGATAFQVVNELRQLEDDPEFSEYLPRNTREATNGLPGGSEIDWNAIQRQAQDLEKMIIADPQFDEFDPQTGLPANRVETPSEAATFFKERGLPNPYETYSSDILADPQALKREEHRVNKAPEIERQARQSQRSVKSADDEYQAYRGGRATADAVARSLLDKEYANDPETTGLTMGDPNAERWWMDAGRVKNTGGGRSDARVANAQRRRADTRETNLGEEVYARRLAAAKDQGAKQKNWNAQQEDMRERARREAMMRQLTQMGVTPFNDVNRARQGNIYGF